MTRKKPLARKIILEVLANALEPLDYVHAFYEGGTISHGRLDELSDIDAYVVVDDGKVNEAFAVVERALTSLLPIKQKYEVPQPGWPGISQAFYRLENTSEYLLIDFCILNLSAPEKFLEPQIHGPAVFYFNKEGRIKIPSLDKAEFSKKIAKRLERLQARFEVFNCFVQKEIKRGNSIEAVDLYHNLTLGLLVEALRIKHKPIHYDFKTSYVSYELPPEVVERLRHLYFARNEKDLQQKYREASIWFQGTMSTISKEKIAEQIGR
jgi:hypothetical protein